MSKPFSRDFQAPYTCDNCDEFIVVEVTEEAEVLYPKPEDCPGCKATIDIDIIAANLTEVRRW